MPLFAALRAFAAAGLVLATTAALPADLPVTEGDWVVRDFRFHTGEVLPELRLHYATLGAPTGEPVLILHGSAQSGQVMLSPAFGGELFGPGQPLDASRYFIVLPDALGHGRSSKPSDGLRASFPQYDYDDLSEAAFRLVTEHLGIKRLRIVIGNSMGGMETWLLAGRHPDFMDIAVPMGSLPVAMPGRNWMMRRLIVDSIRSDPEWNGGNYTTQPRSARFASAFFGLATSGGSRALYKAAPTRATADAIVDARLAAPFTADANDVLYQWDASRDYNPSAALERIEAPLLAINAEDDERNPPELGVMDREIRTLKTGRALLIPASDTTAGHATTFFAKYWKADVAQLLRTVPKGP